jgi:hypothetical protein
LCWPLGFPITRFSHLPLEDSLEPWLDILGTIPLEFWTGTGLRRGYTTPGSVFRQGPLHTTCPEDFSPFSQRHRQGKKSAPVTSHQAPSPGFLSSTPPLPCPQWLPPSLPWDLPAFSYPRSWRSHVLYDHTVSLDQAFQMDRISLLNRQRKAVDLAYWNFCLPVHRLRYWPWSFPRPTPALHRPLPGPSRACLDIKMTTLSTALEL